MVEVSDTKGAGGRRIPVTLEWIGKVAVVTLCRPERRNAVDHESLLLLRTIQQEVAHMARVVVLTGQSPAFCAGADLNGVESDEFADALGAALRGFVELPCITMASIDGPALGAGTQLAVACDLRMATPRSVFGIPAAKLGLAVDQWTIERVSHEFGWPIARHMLLGVGTYTADALHVQGGVHKIGTLVDALDWAEQLATLAPITIAAHKRGLEAVAEKLVVDEAFEQLRTKAWASRDAHEGRTAFLEKRLAEFTGD